MPHATLHVGAIRFDGHAPATAVAALAPVEKGIEPVEIEGQASRQAVDDDHQAFAVRLAGGEKPQHCAQNCIRSFCGSRAARTA